MNFVFLEKGRKGCEKLNEIGSGRSGYTQKQQQRNAHVKTFQMDPISKMKNQSKKWNLNFDKTNIFLENKL